MRKKDILGNFVKHSDTIYTHAIKKLNDEADSYSALISFLPGCRELWINGGENRIQYAGAGYKWLMYLPLDEYWCMSTYYTPDNKLLGWYFDISLGNFIDENGLPCTDDIYLDLAISAHSHILTLDADELQNALDKNEITIDNYNHAYKVLEQIKNSKWSDVEYLTSLSEKLLMDYA